MKKSIVSIFVALVALCASAMANEPQPYNAEAFAQAKQAGKPVVLEFHASWCPTCKAQNQALKALLQTEPFSEVAVFVADYDKETELKREHRVARQSTLVVFKGGEEVARATGVSDPKSISKLIGKAI